eukprot:7950977-Alexandrium_andersonii.AAC.1
MVRRLIKCDARECERVNKAIGLQGDRSPNISLELLSSRVQMKHYLGQALTNDAGANAPARWGEKRLVALDL